MILDDESQTLQIVRNDVNILSENNRIQSHHKRSTTKMVHQRGRASGSKGFLLVLLAMLILLVGSTHADDTPLTQVRNPTNFVLVITF